MRRSKTRIGNPRLLILGDVHGHWDLAARQAKMAVAEYGHLDAIICVGDVEALRSEKEVAEVHGPSKYRKLGKFPEVAAGKITFPTAVYFVGGNHECWLSLDEQGPGEWAPGVWFLGRAGVTEIAGLRVAFLSGIYSPQVSEFMAANKRKDRKDRTYWVKSEVGKVMEAGRGGAIDLLVTHDWPAGIGTNRSGAPAGQEALTAIDRRLRPTVHVCGHMHHRLSATLGETKVEAVGHIRSGGDGSCILEWGSDGVVVYEPLPIAALPRL